MKLAKWKDGFVLNTDPRRADPLYYYMRDGVWDSAIALEVAPLYEEHKAEAVTLSVFAEHQALERSLDAAGRREMYGRVLATLLRRFPQWSNVTLRSAYLSEIMMGDTVPAVFRAAGYSLNAQAGANEQTWRKVQSGGTRSWLAATISRWWMFALVALVGITITMWIDESTKARYPSGQGARPAEFAMLPFWALYVLSTHLLAPWDIMRRRSATVPDDLRAGRMVIYPWWSWLFLGPYLLHDNRAKVPGPVSALLIAVGCILAAWLVLIFTILGGVALRGAMK